MAKMRSSVCTRVSCGLWSTKMLNRCNALTEVIEHDCPFYKTIEQYKKEIEEQKRRDKALQEQSKAYRNVSHRGNNR